MKYKISVEYCTSWGYVGEAVGLAERLLAYFKDDVESFELLPSSGGVFEVVVNGELVFSKKSLNRFPDEGEILDIIEG